VHYVFWCVLCVWAKLPEIKHDDCLSNIHLLSIHCGFLWTGDFSKDVWPVD